MKFRLSTEDAQRLGLPEVLDWDWDVMTVADARLLRKTTGVDAMALPRLWDQRDTEATLALIWMAARRAGVDLKFPELELNLSGLRAVEEPADESGKEQSPASETSTGTPTRTRRSSVTSAT